MALDLESGSTQRATAACTIQSLNGISACAWIKIESVASGVDGTIVFFAAASAGNSTRFSLNIRGTSGPLLSTSSRRDDADAVSTLTYGTTLSTGVLYHVAVTQSYAGGTRALYLNGVSVTSDTPSWSSASDADAGQNAGIGANASGGALSLFDGILQDVRVYTRQLTAAEVLDVYNGGSGGTGPRNQWAMTATSGTAGTITDSGSTPTNASAVNSPTYVGNLVSFWPGPTPASETDTALACALTKHLAPGVCVETDTAVTPTLSKQLAPGISTETDTAFACAATKQFAPGVCVETDTAFACAATKQLTPGTCAETDAAVALTLTKQLAPGVCVETDTAFALTLTSGNTITPGVCVETDTAFACALSKQVAPAVCVEIDTAGAPTLSKQVAPGVSVETAFALSLALRRSITPSVCVETDTAFALVLLGAEQDGIEVLVRGPQPSIEVLVRGPQPSIEILVRGPP